MMSLPMSLSSEWVATSIAVLFPHPQGGNDREVHWQKREGIVRAWGRRAKRVGTGPCGL